LSDWSLERCGWAMRMTDGRDNAEAGRAYKINYVNDNHNAKT